MQIRDLDKGTFGFVQLAVDLTSGEQVAIKFIERSQEVGPGHISACMATACRRFGNIALETGCSKTGAVQ